MQRNLILFRPLILILATVLLLTASGCGSSPKQDKPQMNIDIKDGVSVSSGTEQRLYSVAAGEVGELEVSVQRKSDSLSLSVFSTGDTNTSYYRGTDLQDCSFSVSVPASCTVWIEAKEFVGNYQLNWSVIETKESGK